MLLAISGPLKGALFRLSNEEVTIGRHSSNQLCIGDLSVSRHHCTIRGRDGQHTIQDIGSNNGTLVNGICITDHVLTDGDEIAVGNTVFCFVAQRPAERIEILQCATSSEVVPRSTVRLRKEDFGLATDDYRGPGQDRNILTVLSQLAGMLHSNEATEPIEPKLLELIAGLVPVEQGAIVLAGRSFEDGVSVSGWNRRDGPCASPRVSQNVIDIVVRDRTGFVSSDLSAVSSTAATASQARITSVLAAPLMIAGKVYGVIYLDTTHPSEHFTSGDLEFITVISSYVALAAQLGRLVELQSENRTLRQAAAIQHEMIGNSPAMRKVYDRIAKIAPTDTTVLIGGETGTGKELAAKAIHRNSPRATKPFEAINCALLNETMLESELFGHEKGAFTSAVALKKGKLEIADGGTLFLDEIGELPQTTQGMLLRVLQDRSFYRLGGTRRLYVDIRVIAATNRNLPDLIREKKFREDLFYRLSVVSLTMPPLLERREDISCLAYHFLPRAAEKNKRPKRTISARAMSLLEAYDWPGNVRELENAIEHAVVFGASGDVEPEDLPEVVLEKLARTCGTPLLRYHEAVREARKQIVLKALQQADGSYSEAASLLNINVSNLHRLIRDLDLRGAVQSEKNLD